MNEQNETEQQLIEELGALRRRVAEQDAELAKSREVESERRHIHDRLPVLVATAGLDGYYKQVNAAFERRFGWSEQELLSRLVVDFIHPEDRAIAEETFRRVQSDETVASFLSRNICADGTYRWIDWVMMPVLHQDSIFGIGQDITERLLAEQNLREAKAFADRLLESMLDGVSMLDSQGVHLLVNDAFCRMTGFSREELIGTGPPHPYWPPEEHEALNKAFVQIGLEGVDGVELVFMTKEGERFPVIVAPSCVQDGDGKVVSYIATVKNIKAWKAGEVALKQANEELEQRVKERTKELAATNEQLKHEVEERRRAEESLRQSERRFRNYFEHGLVGMAATSVTKGWLEVNDRLCEIVGYPRDKLFGMTWAEITHPDDLASDCEQFDRLLAGKISHYTMDKRFIREDGTAVYTTILIRAFYSEGGSLDHIVCLMEDITERKQAEEALKRERQTLMHMLRASDHERQLISYEIHDGLAQQLAASIMQFQAYDTVKESDPVQGKTAYDAGMQMLQRAHFEARRLISGVRPPILDDSGITAAIAHLVHEHAGAAAPKVNFHSEVKIGRLAKVLENAIYRIAQESLANALQHSGSERIAVSFIQENGSLRLEVQDWGVGFDPESVDENRFGLEGIRERIKLLGGELSIQSEPGKGTRILAVLPIMEEESSDSRLSPESWRNVGTCGA